MQQTPDKVILNGSLITFDAERPRAGALAISGGVISAVGSTKDIRDLAGPGTRVVDAAGATVLPGFIDSHVHLFAGAVELGYLDLHGVSGEHRLAEMVRRWAAEFPEDRIVFAVQADYAILGPGRGTTRQDLDRVLPDRPFAMFAPDHHTIWANTMALEAAGILHGGPVEQGAQIVMAADGTATGELQEPSAYAPVLRLTRHAGRDLEGLTTGADPVPPATAAQRAVDKAALERGLTHCARHGITGLHNMDGNFYQAELLAEMETGGTLLCRTEVPFHFKSFDPLERFAEAGEMQRRFNSDMVWTNRVKMFMDGVLESRTALMLEPYPDTDHLGDAVFDAGHFTEACIRADAMGLQIATHAIGDLAVRRTLDGYEAAQRANGRRDARHRIEHIEALHADDLPRFRALEVVASYQPGHAPFGGYFPADGMQGILHDHQIPLAFAWQTLRESGAPVVFSTDWPVMPVDVMPNVKAAVAPVDLGDAWPDQRQGLMDTLKSYTADNAWVEFNEHCKGRLAPGMMADVAVMSDDLEAMAPEDLDQAQAVLTVCGGRITWEA